MIRAALKFLVLYSGLFSVTALWADVLVLEEAASGTSVTPYLKILEDPSNSWSIQQANQAFNSQEVITVPSGTPNFGMTNSTYWFAIDTTSASFSDGSWLLEIEYPLIDEVRFYVELEDGSWVSQISGDQVPFGQRKVEHPTLLFPFDIKPGEDKRLLLSVKTQGSVQLPARIWRPDDFSIEAKNDYIILGVYYGIMLAMVLYNLFILIAVRDVSYLYYILYVINISLYTFANKGFATQYLWPDSPELGTYSVTTSAYIAATFGLLFCKSYLRVADNAPRLNAILNVFVATTLLAILSPLVLSYQTAIIVGTLNAIIVAFMLLYSGLYIMLQGQRAARYFFVAWLVFLVAVILIALQRLGMIPGNFIVEEGILFGTSIEVILLSLGLADRINTLQREKESVQQELLQRNAETIAALQQASAIKDEFVANVSHELRTPLTGIIGLSELVLDSNREQLNEESKVNLNMIRSSGQRLTSLVNDIIDVSAINRNYLEVDREPIDLASTAKFVIAMCNPMLGNKPVTLSSEIPSDLPLVDADENRMTQVFFNLVANAIKFTPSGSIRISAEQLEDSVTISVIDTGIGIPVDKQAEIFEPFKQLDGAIDREVGGTGLGLSITKKIIELHGSSIEIKSAPGQGTAFYFALPIAAEQEIDKRKIPTTIDLDVPELSIDNTALLPIAADDKSRTVLVVDDEYANLHILQEFLKPYCRVLTAQDGYEALDILKTTEPDMMVVDLMMPRMSGYELCQVIRQTRSLAELPILILTAKTQTEDLVAGLRAGANDYLSKPFHREELIARVQKQLQLKELIEIRDANLKLEEQIIRYKDSEEQLQTDQLRLAAMLDYGEEFLVCVDSGGEIIHATKSVADVLDTDVDSIEGLAIDSLTDDVAGNVLTFPFDQSAISEDNDPHFFPCHFKTVKGESRNAQVCILTLDLEQEFYVLIFHPSDSDIAETPESAQLIAEVNKNAQRTQILGALLGQITPPILQEEPKLLRELEKIDGVIAELSSTVSFSMKDEEFRQSLVTLMQNCINLWERYTQRTVIDLAEESKIWRINIDNGRLRARSMERYLDIAKLPKNPRWREVTRTGYYLLGNVELNEPDRNKLEDEIIRLDQFARS